MKKSCLAATTMLLGFLLPGCSASAPASNWLLGSWVLQGQTQGCKAWYTFAKTTETHDFYGKPSTIDVTYAVTGKDKDDIGVMGNLGNGFMFHRLDPNTMKGEGGCVYTRKK